MAKKIKRIARLMNYIDDCETKKQKELKRLGELSQ